MEKIAKQLTVRYALVQSTYWISQCIIYSFAAVYLQYKNFNNTDIGIVLSLSAIISIILQPLVSALADKYRRITVRKLVLLLMLIAFALALLLQLAPDAFLLIAATFVVINAVQFTLNPLLNSLALDYLNQGVPMNYGLARGTASIAFAFTSYFLGYFVDRFSPGIILPFFIISYVLFFGAAYAFRLKNSPVKAADVMSSSLGASRLQSHDMTEELALPAPSSVLGFFVKYKKYTFLLMGVSLIFYTHSLINTYLINIIDHLGGSSADMGLTLTIAAALELPAMAAFGIIATKVKCSTLLKLSAFFFFIKSLIILLAPNVLMVHLSQTFQMFSYAVFTPASVYYVNSIIAKQDKNKGQAMLGVATLGVSGTAAFITGGKILDTFGVPDMLLIGAIASFLGFVVICFSTENRTEGRAGQRDGVDVTMGHGTGGRG